MVKGVFIWDKDICVFVLLFAFNAYFDCILSKK